MTYPREKAVINTLVECQVIFDATGNIAGLIERHPDFAAEIAGYFALVDGLSSTELPEPDARKQIASKRDLLQAVVAKREKNRRLVLTPFVGLAGSLLLFCLCIGVSAAAGVPGVRSSINSVLDTIGIENTAANHDNPNGPKPTASPVPHGAGPVNPGELSNGIGGTGSGHADQLSPNGQPVPSLGEPRSFEGNVPTPGGKVSPLSNAGSSAANATSSASGNSTEGKTPGQNNVGDDSSGNNGVGSTGTPPGQGGAPPSQSSVGGNGNSNNGIGTAGTPPGQGGTPPGQSNTGGNSNGNGVGSAGTPPGQGGTSPGQSSAGGNANGSNGVGSAGAPPGRGGTPPGQSSAGGNTNKPPAPTPIPTQPPVRSAPAQPAPPGQGGTPPGQAGSPPGQSGNNVKKQ